MIFYFLALHKSYMTIAIHIQREIERGIYRQLLKKNIGASEYAEIGPKMQMLLYFLMLHDCVRIGQSE